MYPYTCTRAQDEVLVLVLVLATNVGILKTCLLTTRGNRYAVKLSHDMLLKSVEFDDDVTLILSVAGLGMRPHVTP